MPAPHRVAGRPAPARTDPLAALRAASTAPAVALAAWIALAWPLAALGWARPLPAALLAVPALAGAVAVGRLVRRPDVGAVAPSPAPRWAVPATLAVSTVWGVLAAVLHAEQVVLRRDPGSYALIGRWLARTGGLRVPDALAAVGGPAPDVTAASPAFYADGSGGLVPQFLVGQHLLDAAGSWLGGWTGLLVAPAVVGALALVAAGGLAGRLLGPAWAPWAAGLTGLVAPVAHVMRATYSEPFAMLLLLAGLCLVLDARDAAPGTGTDRWLALAGGLLVGLGALVRIDVLREAVLLVLVVGWLAWRRERVWWPLAAGLAAGLGWSLLADVVTSRPYLADNAGSLVPLLWGAGGVVVAVAVAVPVLRRAVPPDVAAPGRVREAWRRAAPRAGAGLTAVVLLALAVRPWWQTVHQPAADAGGRSLAEAVGGLQRVQGLPVDPTRTYAEHAVQWLSWWVGWGGLALAGAAAVGLVGAVLAGRAPRWVPVLVPLLGSTVLSVYRPAITPDHPWADRRFVPLVLPGLVLLALTAVAWGLGRRGDRARSVHVLTWVLSAAALAGTLVGAVPLLPVRTERGELAAVRQACAALDPGDVVLLVDLRAQREWPAPLRTACGVPAVSVLDPSPARVRAVAERARTRGYRPVLA
ncbi:MAG TPA: hypothetical protein VFS29_12095, partial [Motilibacteraceae bacterium]|nr:hypothetical protein [Motilibacteraceae bacterium]